jgi:hypothetical protein
MRALITASFDPVARARLERHMEVVHEDWRERHHIYFDGAAFVRRIIDAGADVLIVEADMVGTDVIEACTLRLIGCCRGEPANVDVDAATRRGIPVVHAPGRNADAVADLTLAFILTWCRHLHVLEAYYLRSPFTLMRMPWRCMLPWPMRRIISGLLPPGRAICAPRGFCRSPVKQVPMLSIPDMASLRKMPGLPPPVPRPGSLLLARR